MSNETKNGGDAMPVEFEKTRLNVWNVGGIFVSIVVTAFGWGVIYSKMETNDNDAKASIAQLREDFKTEVMARQTRGTQTDARFYAIEQKIPQFEVIAQQIQRLTEISAQNSKAIEAANERMNRIVESQSGKLDAIIKSVADLTTEVRVVQSQIKDRNNLEKSRFPMIDPADLPQVRIK